MIRKLNGVDSNTRPAATTIHRTTTGNGALYPEIRSRRAETAASLTPSAPGGGLVAVNRRNAVANAPGACC